MSPDLATERLSDACAGCKAGCCGKRVPPQDHSEQGAAWLARISHLRKMREWSPAGEDRLYDVYECVQFDKTTRLCKVHGTSEKPTYCREYLCRRAGRHNTEQQGHVFDPEEWNERGPSSAPIGRQTDV